MLKGSGDDELVLCTDEETYSVAMVETSNTLLLLRPPTEMESSKFEGSSTCAAVGGNSSSLSLVVEGLLGGQLEMKRVVAGIHRVREILVEEEWRDAQGRLPGGMAMGAGLSAVGRGRGGGDGAPPPKVGEADVEEGDDEEGLRALQMQEELEGMEEETSGLRAQREGTGGGKTMGYVAAAPPPPSTTHKM